MTLLIASVMTESPADLRSCAAQGWTNGADAIEVRIDGFKGDLDELAQFLRSQNHGKWIVTCRSAKEGGLAGGDATERLSNLEMAARKTGASVDFEYRDWVSSSDLKDRLSHLIASTKPACSDASAKTNESHDPPNPRLILSTHEFCEKRTTCDSPPDRRDADIIAAAHQLNPPAVAKVAYVASHINESFYALDMMRNHGSSIIAIAMGEDGLWSRVLAKKLGAFATFCSLEDDSATAPGQPTLIEMLNLYRWDRIDKDTQVFGVVGDPVKHSMSPRVFNQWFQEEDINAVYLPLRVRNTQRGLTEFLDACAKRDWLDLVGLSVTIPHKSSALDWAGDGADWMARRIGAANTISFRGRRVRAFNTDCYAAAASLCEGLGGDLRELSNLSVDVLGTGGAARAILYGLSMSGCKVTLYGRSAERTRALAEVYDVEPAAWGDRVRGTGKVLVHCTSLGMWPETQQSPMPADHLGTYELVFDLIYNPLQTQLLRDASAAGTKTVNGLDMFMRQAAMQFELWTGRPPNKATAKALIEEELRQRTGKTA